MVDQLNGSMHQQDLLSYNFLSDLPTSGVRVRARLF